MSEGTVTLYGKVPANGPQYTLELPLPDKFDHVDYDHDVRTWLWSVQHVGELAGLQPSEWARMASSLLDGEAKKVYCIHFAQTCRDNTMAQLYDWEKFQDWCDGNLRKPDFRLHHYDRLHETEADRFRL